MAIDDLFANHFFSCRRRLFLVNPVRLMPFFWCNLAIMTFRLGEGLCMLFEFVCKVVVVQEDIVVAGPMIETILDLLHAFEEWPQIAIPC